MVAGLSLIATLSSPPRASAANDLERGQRIYFEACVACHGSDGAGAMPEVADFGVANGPLFKTDAQLLKSISKGVTSDDGSTSMPPMGGNPDLTEEDARHVLEFIRAEFGPK